MKMNQIVIQPYVMDIKRDLNFQQPPYIEQWVQKVTAFSSEYKDGWYASNVEGLFIRLYSYYEVHHVHIRNMEI